MQSNPLESLNNAIRGITHVVRTQKNMRYHFIAAILVVIFCLYLKMGPMDVLIVTCTICLVLLTEMLNTAAEQVVDLITDEYHPVARKIKDITAGAVLIASINAMVAGYFLIARQFAPDIERILTKVRQSPWHTTFIALIALVFLVIIIKVLFGRGTPVRGGMPSGHSALAFSIWTATVFVVHEEVTLIALLVFIMALMVSFGRVRSGIHSVWEVLGGALIGIFFTAFVFQIINQESIGAKMFNFLTSYGISSAPE